MYVHNTFYTIQTKGKTKDGVMVHSVNKKWVSLDHQEPGDPMLFSSIEFTEWTGDWDEPYIWKSREEAQDDLDLVPEDIRSVLQVVEWASSYELGGAAAEAEIACEAGKDLETMRVLFGQVLDQIKKGYAHGGLLATRYKFDASELRAVIAAIKAQQDSITEDADLLSWTDEQYTVVKEALSRMGRAKRMQTTPDAQEDQSTPVCACAKQGGVDAKTRAVVDAARECCSAWYRKRDVGICVNNLGEALEALASEPTVPSKTYTAPKRRHREGPRRVERFRRLCSSSIKNNRRYRNRRWGQTDRRVTGKGE